MKRTVGRWQRSFNLAEGAWQVMRARPVLLGMAALSLVISATAAGAIAGPVLMDEAATDGQRYLAGALAWIVAGAVWAYFHAAITAGAMQHLDGDDPTLSSSTTVATSLLPAVLAWALLAWMVTAIFRLVRDRVPVAGWLLALVGEAVWSIATYLAMPVIVAERVGPVAGIKRSAAMLRRTWGENVIGQVGIGLFSMALFIPAALITCLALAVAVPFGVVVGVVTVGGVTAVTVALDAVYRVALYRYATKMDLPVSFDYDDLHEAFTRKKR